MGRIGGANPRQPYLTTRGASLRVRVQVPKHLREIVGKRELIATLGSKFSAQEYHEVVAEFLARIERARERLTTPPRSRSAIIPTEGEVEEACRAYFKRMASNMRGKVAQPVGSHPQTRLNRIEGYRQMIENHLDLIEMDQWEAMSAQASWLCDENGWAFQDQREAFAALCRTMLRARLHFYRDELRRLEGRFAADPDADPLFAAERPSQSKRALTFSDLVAKFKAAKSLKWKVSTTKNYVIIFRVIEEICGRDLVLTSIDQEFCIGVRDRLLQLPANYQKHPATRGRSLSEAIQIASDKGLPTISPATVNSHLNKLGAIIRYGRDQGWIVGNPMAGIDVADPIDADEKRDPFSVEQLNAIFATSPWKEGAASAIERPSRFWAPLVALYSGARLSEICGQKVEEMIVEGGVRALHLRHRPDDRTIKNGKSRKVPVHQQLVQLGFWDFVEAAQASGRDMLFGDVTRDRYGKWGDGTSKWFSRLIRKLNLKGTNLAFHSFRHNFEDALKEIDLHDTPIGNTLTGRWSPGVSKNYGKAYSLAKLDEAIQRVSYPGLKLDHLMAAGAQTE